MTRLKTVHAATCPASAPLCLLTVHWQARGILLFLSTSTERCAKTDPSPGSKTHYHWSRVLGLPRSTPTVGRPVTNCTYSPAPRLLTKSAVTFSEKHALIPPGSAWHRLYLKASPAVRWRDGGCPSGHTTIAEVYAWGSTCHPREKSLPQ